jgi:hypothetical protein
VEIPKIPVIERIRTPSPKLPVTPPGPTKEELKQLKKEKEDARVLLLIQKLYFNRWRENARLLKEQRLEKERVRKFSENSHIFLGRRRKETEISAIPVFAWN